MTWDDLSEYADFVQEFVGEVEEAFSAGRTVDETAESLTIQERYSGYDMTDARAMIEVLYGELASR